MGRNAISVDINSEVVKLSNTNLSFTCQSGIIRYSKEISGDISHLKYEKFLKEVNKSQKNPITIVNVEF